MFYLRATLNVRSQCVSWHFHLFHSFVYSCLNENPSCFTSRTTLFSGIFVPNVQVDMFNWFHSFVYSCLIKTPLCFISEQLWILVLDMIHLFHSFISLEMIFCPPWPTTYIILLCILSLFCDKIITTAYCFKQLYLFFDTWIEGMQHMIKQEPPTRW